MRIDGATKILDDWMEVLRVTDQDADIDSAVPGHCIPGVWLCSPEWANKMCGLKLQVEMQNNTPLNFTNVNAFTSENVHYSFGKFA